MPIIDIVGVLARHAANLALAVAAEVDRPRERVHVIFEPDAAERVFFGGAPTSR